MDMERRVSFLRGVNFKNLAPSSLRKMECDTGSKRWFASGLISRLVCVQVWARLEEGHLAEDSRAQRGRS